MFATPRALTARALRTPPVPAAALPLDMIILCVCRCRARAWGDLGQRGGASGRCGHLGSTLSLASPADAPKTPRDGTEDWRPTAPSTYAARTHCIYLCLDRVALWRCCACGCRGVWRQGVVCPCKVVCRPWQLPPNTPHVPVAPLHAPPNPYISGFHTRTALTYCAWCCVGGAAAPLLWGGVWGWGGGGRPVHPDGIMVVGSCVCAP